MKKAIFFYSLKVLIPTVIAAILWWCSAEPLVRGGPLAAVALIVLVASGIVAGGCYEGDIGKEKRTIYQRFHEADFELTGLRRSTNELRRALANQETNVEELNRELRLRTKELGIARATLLAQTTELNAAKETIKELEAKP